MSTTEGPYIIAEYGRSEGRPTPSRDGNGSLKIMAPYTGPDADEDMHKPVAAILPQVRHKRGAAWSAPVSADPEQFANACLFMAAWELREALAGMVALRLAVIRGESVAGGEAAIVAAAEAALAKADPANAPSFEEA